MLRIVALDSCRARSSPIRSPVKRVIPALSVATSVPPPIAAARAALRRVEEEILRDHVAHCVEHAISSGDQADQRRKIAELMDVVSRADR
jgi:DNA-binding FrmR family transcriptional regulator